MLQNQAGIRKTDQECCLTVNNKEKKNFHLLRDLKMSLKNNPVLVSDRIKQITKQSKEPAMKSSDPFFHSELKCVQTVCRDFGHKNLNLNPSTRSYSGPLSLCSSRTVH